MKFRSSLALGAFAIFPLWACSNGGGNADSQTDTGGEGGSAGSSESGGNGSTPVSSGGTSGLGGQGGGQAGGLAGQSQAGSGGAVVVIPPGGSDLDTSAWGPCQMIVVPAGLTANPSKQTATVANKCIPAGSGMSRSLSLMATSTPQRRHKVKVLFYGQSITRGGWVPLTQAHLRNTFPNADLDMRMEAVGGFTAKLLMGPLEHDVLPWYPDLIVYHTLGPTEDTEIFLQVLRRKTTAEIMQQTQHVSTEGDNTQLAYDKESYIHYPNISKRLGTHIIDIRTPWKAHLEQTGKPAGDLLRDGLHINEAGNVLYAEITNSQLKYDSKVIVDPLRMVTTYEVDKDVKWVGQKLTLPFEGSRVEVLAKSGGNLSVGAATVLIDGKKPSEFREAYGITRPNREVDSDWPWGKGSVTHVTMDPGVQPKAEKWTMTLTSIDKAGNCTFSVAGSVTGPDGEGTCASAFTSNSKRVVIKKEAFFFAPAQDPNGPSKITIPNGYKINWDVVALHADIYPPSSIDVSDKTKEQFTTLIQGIPNGKHTLEITAAGATPPAIEAIRVHRPPLR